MAAPAHLPLALAAAVFLSGCVAPVATEPAASEPRTVVSAASAFTKLVCDPDCARLLTRGTGPANEIGLAMDPNNPLRLLAGAKDYNPQQTPCVEISWFLSEDGGRTWKDGYFHPARPVPVPKLAGLPIPVLDDASECESDPVPVFDGRGNALMSSLVYSGDHLGLPTYRLKPGASEWETVAPAYVGSTDKQWADVDPVSGDVYLVTRDLREGASHAEEILRTRDGGETWEHVAYLDGLDFGAIAITNEGAIVVAGVTPDFKQLVTMRSADGGVTWTGPEARDALRLDAPFFYYGYGKGYRTPVIASIAAADTSPRVVVAWHNGDGFGDWDAFVSVSDDGGVTWSDPIRATDDASGSDQFTPTAAVSPSGAVHLVWFDARNEPTGQGYFVDVYYAHSKDGRAFDPNLRITERTFPVALSPHQNAPFYLGEYMGIAASDREAYLVYPDASGGRADLFAAIVGG